MVKKIMIVDDDRGVIHTVKTGLESFTDYEVTGAEGGLKCFEILKEGLIPDLILLDIMMPDMKGWEVLNRLRDNPHWKDIPIIFLTAKTDDFSKAFGGSVSEDYIEKPFKLPDLKARIDKVFVEEI